jgi:hypothetical protein
MANGSGGELRLELAVDNAQAAELDRITANLRRDLLLLNVDDVYRLREGPPPPGTRGVELVALGSLIVAVGKVAGALSSVVRALQAWVCHKPERRVRLEVDGDVLELSGATAEQQQQLVSEWLARHHSG